MRRWATLILAGIPALGLVACGDNEGGGTLSDALCNDIEAGITPLQMFGSMRDRYDTGADLADDTFGHALVGCPEIFDDADHPWTIFFAENGLRP